MTRQIAVAAAVLVVAVVGGIWVASMLGGSDDRFAQCREGQVAGGVDIGGPFELVNSMGETVTDKEVIDTPALIYFGYTFCPDVCPLDNARNAEAVDILEERGFDVTPVFISIDPERDTPEVLGDYVSNVSGRIVGITGEPEKVFAMAKSFDIYFRKVELDSGDYTMDHTASILLLDSSGDFAGTIAYGENPDNAIAKLKRLAAKS